MKACLFFWSIFLYKLTYYWIFMKARPTKNVGSSCHFCVFDKRLSSEFVCSDVVRLWLFLYLDEMLQPTITQCIHILVLLSPPAAIDTISSGIGPDLHLPLCSFLLNAPTVCPSQRPYPSDFWVFGVKLGN